MKKLIYKLLGFGKYYQKIYNEALRDVDIEVRILNIQTSNNHELIEVMRIIKMLMI